ncbi:MAG: hypothetical protein ACK4EX_06575 [Thermaurantimonas sp.]|uniref:hypothetical protein n=1 Tax=Thermaurantimonas sp. TaxID=2681568 RepID=UPI00391DDFA0
MKKVFLSIVSVFTLSLSAQPFAYQSGEKTISLGVNSVFSYFGNFFSRNDNFTNQLSIPIDGNFVYRHFHTPTNATRYQFSLFLNQTNTGSINIGTAENNFFFNASYLWGREKHVYLNKFNVYSFYGIGPGLLYRSNVREDFNVAPNEKVTQVDGPVISALATAGIGLEYRFSQRFFIGADASVQGNVRYSVQNRIERLDKTTNQLNVNESRNSISASLFIINSVIFRAGIRF